MPWISGSEGEKGQFCVVEWALWAPSLVEGLQLPNSTDSSLLKRTFDYVVGIIDEWRFRTMRRRRKRRSSQNSGKAKGIHLYIYILGKNHLKNIILRAVADDLKKSPRGPLATHKFLISQDVCCNFFREWLPECGYEHWQLVEVAMASITAGSPLGCYRQADVVELTKNYLNVLWTWPPWEKKQDFKKAAEMPSSDSPVRECGKCREREREGVLLFFS